MSCWHLIITAVSYAIDAMATSQNYAGLRHYLDTILSTEICVVAISIGLKISNDFQKEDKSNVYSWFLLYLSAWLRDAFACCF